MHHPRISPSGKTLADKKTDTQHPLFFSLFFFGKQCTRGSHLYRSFGEQQEHACCHVGFGGKRARKEVRLLLLSLHDIDDDSDQLDAKKNL